MELRHMRYFVAVAEYLHFGRAAEALATAQPSLSRQILQLEDELGVQLFERTNRRVELTDAGRLFLIDARRTLQAADASIRHARENAEGTRGELRIGFLDGAMLMVLPSIFREYRRRYPNVIVTPHAMQYPDHVAALRAGSIDIAWTIAASDPEIISQIVTTDGLMAALPSDHRLADRVEVNVAEFKGEPLIMLSRENAPLLFDLTMDLCTENGYRPPDIHEVPDLTTVLGLVAAGFGVALPPYPWSVVGVRGLVYRKIVSNQYIEEALSWHRDRDTAIVRSFVAVALEMLASKDDVSYK
jgi:DNA-binding transcriptional LysR family regulator